MNRPPARKRFGVFLAPFHHPDVDPTLQLRGDLDFVGELEQLGFDEIWIGEHHSGAYEIIASPELFIAAAAERTERIRLGTGVVSLPYHNPLMLADRMNQLDHQTRGRAMLGVGPGQLPSDAFMMGIEVARQREMMLESLEVLAPLLRGEVVTRKTDWFDLREARVQLPPYTEGGLEMAVAASISPSGPRAAGAHGIGMLSVAATNAQGFNALPAHWAVCEQKAEEHGQRVDRANWRLVAPMHIAETREQAAADMQHGLLKFIRYIEKLSASKLPGTETWESATQQWRDNGLAIVGTAIIGTPDDAIARILELEKQSGGFGSFLLLAHDAASPEATRRSYELFARYVMPEINRLNQSRNDSLEWAHDNSGRFIGAMVGGIGKAIAEHEAERQAAGGEGAAWPTPPIAPPERD